MLRKIKIKENKNVKILWNKKFYFEEKYIFNNLYYLSKFK